MTAEKRKRVLIAFDFDHTIIDDNSDTYIQRLAPNGGKIPEEITKLYSSRGWTKFMSEVFKYLRSNGTNQTQLLDCVAEIPLVNGMLELLTYLTPSEKEDAAAVQTVQEQMVVYDAIIISDSNSVCQVYLSCILQVVIRFRLFTE
jgi:pyridoxal phosphate phosphatase PHOSPHO2